MEEGAPLSLPSSPSQAQWYMFPAQSLQSTGGWGHLMLAAPWGLILGTRKGSLAHTYARPMRGKKGPAGTQETASPAQEYKHGTLAFLCPFQVGDEWSLCLPSPLLFPGFTYLSHTLPLCQLLNVGKCRSFLLPHFKDMGGVEEREVGGMC